MEVAKASCLGHGLARNAAFSLAHKSGNLCGLCTGDFSNNLPEKGTDLPKVMPLVERRRGVTALAKLAFFKVLVFAFYNALSAEAFVRIITPSEGETLAAKGPNMLTYEAVTGASKGNHVHVYVDGKEVGTLHRLKGNYSLKELMPGTREICVKVANKAHVPIGVDHCIRVRVE